MQSKQAIKKQIIDDISQMIFSGILKRGDFLPSIRIMSDRYNVSRGTVLVVYKTLESLGYIQGHERSGYLVISAPEGRDPQPQIGKTAEKQPPHSEKKPPVTAAYQSLERHNRTQLPKHFIRRWCLGSSSPQLQTGWNRWEVSDKRLKNSLCRFILISRGISLLPENMVLSSGMQEALLLIGASVASTRQQPTILVEDPCPLHVRELFRSLNFRVLPIAVDQQGICVADFPAAGADLIFTSPARQFPMGVSLSDSRRHTLYEWACHHNALIIENDCFAMLGFGQSVTPALRHQYPDPHIIYLTHLAELTGSGINVCCIAASPQFIQLIRQFIPLLTSDTNPLTSALLSSFLDSPHFMKYLTGRLQARQQKVALAQEGIQQRWPGMDYDGSENSGFLTFHTGIRQLPEGLINRYFFPVDIFRLVSQEKRQARAGIIYPFDLLSFAEIEKINLQLQDASDVCY